MDLFKQGKQGMKGPSRPAPAAPPARYSPVTNWNDDPFEADLFEPKPYAHKKPPPPRPPPPKLNPPKGHFIRKPTVLTSLLSRKKTTASVLTPIAHANTDDRFARCELKVQTGALIDLSSPPSSPTFTTRSSSDGVSVDSFGSDATSSTNHQRMNGSVSQAESGFEDDFDLFRKIGRDDTFEDLIDPFSPPPARTAAVRKCDAKPAPVSVSSTAKGPTIIRAKPARPRPPAPARLRAAHARAAPVMTLNTGGVPIQKVERAGESCYDLNFGWDSNEPSPEREVSPPMPCVPPPPPPALDDDVTTLGLDDVTTLGLDDVIGDVAWAPADKSVAEGPYAISLYDYSSGHHEDLEFKANARITLLRRENAEWYRGAVGGAEGLFPANYVEVKVPLAEVSLTPATPVTPVTLGTATALYDFEPVQAGDLRFACGDRIQVSHKLSGEWYYGECGGVTGQFPANYVEFDS